MFEILAVTSRKLCEGDFLAQLKKISKAGVSSVILREKDLSPGEYAALAREAAAICEAAGSVFTPHFFADTARELGLGRIHLPLRVLEERHELRKEFDVIGVSVHSVEQACSAAALGADYLTAGHVFATDCKKDAPPRGVDWLREVCGCVEIPVYAIGGIGAQNIGAVRDAGAAGACVMSAFMRGEPRELVCSLIKTLE